MTGRRDFLRVAGGCVAHVLLSSACASRQARARWTAPINPTVATTSFARLDAIGADSWAVISTPLGGDRTTFANGGIMAGRNGVVVVEGFYRPAGATWLAQQARNLTGRWPTHVVLTHYHVDHAAGVGGYLDRNASVASPAPATATGSGVAAPPAAPVLRATDVTRRLALGGGPVAPVRDPALDRAFSDVVIVRADGPTAIDLGNRWLMVHPLDGHTASDLAIVDEDAGITFAGDLLWNGMFPNYVDARPSRLAWSMRRLAQRTTDAFVPGHGAMADGTNVTRYLDLLGELERVARRGHAAGRSATEAVDGYLLPASLGDWMAGKTGLERAMTAWYRELGTS